MHPPGHMPSINRAAGHITFLFTSKRAYFGAHPINQNPRSNPLSPLHLQNYGICFIENCISNQLNPEDKRLR